MRADLPTRDQIGTCSSCGAAIRWVHTTSGRAMPLDPVPVADGNVVFTGRSLTNDRGIARPEVRVEDTASMFDDGEPRYVTHFASCPHADQHRRTR